MLYLNVDDESVRTEHAAAVGEIGDRGLLYPVTYIDGAALYDGAVSYPAILRAVQEKLDAQSA